MEGSPKEMTFKEDLEEWAGFWPHTQAEGTSTKHRKADGIPDTATGTLAKGVIGKEPNWMLETRYFYSKCSN